ncbi:Alpha/Beta hydrolase protein [Lentinula raphanica]|uniref:Alpha/Beta hydrolase protein n=1 Tax=Lentinula raphanica TaxID=153919 RepID=A0AA38P4E4_9AGAR|nr:Alpha/Beta hydrolase protein [Lentinula raphanica]KAJ3968507.1 Alpha/Beta hydrolase protein [Lentinula raphanica]
MAKVQRRTMVYKTLDSTSGEHTPVLLDVHYPHNISSTTAIDHADIPLGALVYFHGGGLTVGNRTSWFPDWLQKRTTDAGHIFISPDYRLIPSGSTTGHDILEDVLDVFRFVANLSIDVIPEPSDREQNPARPLQIRVDPERIAVSGSSAGALCAYLAAMHAFPKPRAVLSMYGLGGNFLIPHYYTPKYEVFFRGRELLDPALFSDFLYPACLSPDSRVITDSPNTYFPPDAPSDVIAEPGLETNTGPPGFPSNRRMFLARLYLQLGDFLDYYTGEYEPSLSAAFRMKAEGMRNSSPSSESVRSLEDALARMIPSKHRRLFPSLCPPDTYSSWPPVYFLHGYNDSAVLVRESQDLHALLTEAGVRSVLSIAQGMEHSFDYEPNADAVHGEEFDKIGAWMDGILRASS